ncbi:HEPN domain-containing protein [soil metagenome]
MVDAEEYGRWRKEADRAQEGARAQAAVGLHNWACFSAEQAAQLAIKGLLHGLGSGPWGHDLVRLGELMTEEGVEIPAAVMDALRRLGRHYIPARYPDAHAAGEPGAHYSENDWLEAEGDAAVIVSFVDEVWGSANA